MEQLRTLIHQHKRPLIVLFLTWGLYFIVLFSRVLYIKDDVVYAGHPNVWGDWSLHIAMANIFATKSPDLWFAYHPIYAGGQFTYPFLTNLISGLLMRSGLSLVMAFVLPSIVYSLALLLGLYTVANQVLKSKKGAYLAICLFMFSSGLGFTRYFFSADARHNWQAQVITSLPQYEWYTGNLIDGMLLPQRSFLLGMPIALWSLIGLLKFMRHPDQPNKIQLVMSGLFAGVLPITHIHSYITLGIITFFMVCCRLKYWRSLSLFAVPAIGLGGLMYWIFIQGGIENPNFIRWEPFWTAHNFLDWIKQWWLQWGFMIPGAIFGLVVTWRSLANWQKAFFLSFFAIFLLASFILFQPARWDNTKFFLWVYWGLSLLAVVTLQWLWRKGGWMKFSSLLLAFSLMMTGMIEMTRLQLRPLYPIVMGNQDDRALGQFAKTRTEPLARFLEAPDFNVAIMTWGVRPILMGYPAWVQNFGFLANQRERDIQTIYRGDPTSFALLKQYNVSYVVVGLTEKRELHANETFFAEHFPLVYTNASYHVYDTRDVSSER